MRQSTIGLLAIVALCSAFLCVRRNSNSVISASRRDTLVLNIGSPPLELHPQFLQDVHSTIISKHLYEGLFRLGTGKKLLPGLAEQMYVSEDVIPAEDFRYSEQVYLSCDFL